MLFTFFLLISIIVVFVSSTNTSMVQLDGSVSISDVEPPLWFKEFATSIMGKIDNVVERMGKMEGKLDQFEGKLDQVVDIQRREHEFVPDRVEFLRSITGLFESPLCGESSTFFVMEYNHHVAEVTVSHLRCKRPEIYDYLSPCDNLDIAISTYCPRLNRSFDGTFMARLREGDPVVSFGFGVDVRSWTGIVGGPFEKGNDVDIHFSGEAILNDNEFLALGDQFIGQSGGLVINSRGAVGVAHTFDRERKRVVGIVPFADVQSCFDKLIPRKAIKRVEECQGVQKVSPPTLDFL
mmetsp:Transcript_4146/g.6207  ORF Transcript_4146/g.6207 Transcript_4146/m.6207 type:complete len:294 (+) Transcript_4146:54-935(+)